MEGLIPLDPDESADDPERTRVDGPHRARRFYEGIGWRFVTLHRGAVTRARELKPEIPLTGVDGIPIADEYEFERRLARRSTS